jgi:hypothetical protein
VLTVSCAVHHRPHEMPEPLPPLARQAEICDTPFGQERLLRMQGLTCALGGREVAAFTEGLPRDGVPASRCPMRVRVVGGRVAAEPISYASAFDLLPWEECVPREHLLGARHVIRVDDGFLVANEGPFESEVTWMSEDGLERRVVSTARVVGFARTRSGAVLGLGVGAARLGRGGVLRFDHTGRGAWTPSLVAVLPLTPSAVLLDDGGTIVGYAQRFLFRVSEDGRIENVHYLSRDVGRVTSIARAPGDVYYLGLECGIVRIAANDESFWSARDGASGRWTECPGAE